VAKLIYSAICSIDGYIADDEGNFDWAFPGEEVHAFINETERSVGTNLYGRRMYDVMSAWETIDSGPDVSPTMQDFAVTWRAAEKIVYSTTLEAVSTPRTRLERSFDPDAIRCLKSSADRDISIGGPDLAAHALRAGLIDECCLYLAPVIVGGGNPALPPDIHLPLALIEERRFDNGFVYLRYRTAE
jgi:dihydrofolate reductase